MATELARAYVQILPSAKGIAGNLEKELRPLEDAGDRAGKGFADKFQRTAGMSLDQFAKKAALATVALGVGLFSAAKAAGSLDAAISANVQVLGDASAAVQEWAKDSVENVGLSERAALEAATAFGQLAKVAGLSGPDISAFAQEFVVLAADMAAFKDVPIGQAIEDLQSAFAGQTETVRKYGIFLDEASLKSAYFRATGEEVTGTLTAQQRILATQAALLEQTTDIQGQAAREADGLARAQDNLKATAENAAASFGRALVPAATAVVTALATGAEKFADFNDAAGGAPAKIVAVTTVLLGVAAIGAKAYTTFGNIAEQLGKLGVTAKGAGIAFAAAAAGFAVWQINAAADAKNLSELERGITLLARNTDQELIPALIGLREAGDWSKTVDADEFLEKVAELAPGAIARLLELEEASGFVTDALLAQGQSTDEAAAFIADLAKALDVERVAQSQAEETAKAGAEAITGVGEAAETAAPLVWESTAASEALWAELANVDLMAGRAGFALDAVTLEARNSWQAMGEATAAAETFQSALEHLAGQKIGVQAAADELVATWQEMDNVVAETAKGTDGFSTSLDQNTEQGRANREMFRGAAEQVLAHSGAMIENGASTDEASAAALYNTAQLRNQLIQFGLTEQEADAYIDTLGLTPENITTAVELAGVEAARVAVQGHLDRLSGIPEEERTEIQALIDEGDYATANTRLNDLAKPRTVTYRVTTTGNFGLNPGLNPVISAAGRFVPGGSNLLSTFGEVPGRRGDELILPLGDQARMARLLSMPQVFGRVLKAMPVAGVASGNGGGTVLNGDIVTADFREALRELDRREFVRQSRPPSVTA